jgi:hypothetical protein
MPSSGQQGASPAAACVETAASQIDSFWLFSVQCDTAAIIPEAELRSAGQTGRLPLRGAGRKREIYPDQLLEIQFPLQTTNSVVARSQARTGEDARRSIYAERGR